MFLKQNEILAVATAVMWSYMPWRNVNVMP
jgi:hypothetical protein